MSFFINLTPSYSGIQHRRHPQYENLYKDWQLYRHIFEGGRVFRTRYLVKSSKREEDKDFQERRAITPIPGHAKAAIFEVRNALYERFVDITRQGGSRKYNEAVKGEARGVDGGGSSMNKFMGTDILPELLSLGKVAIMVDSPRQGSLTRSETERMSPYLYMFTAEQIRSWNYAEGELISVLLEEKSNEVDPATSLIIGVQTKFLLYQKKENGVLLTVYDSKGIEQDEEVELLDLERIPVVILDLGTSLLTDIAYHQIALLNLGSLDIAYALRANFPFYTEQYDYKAENANQRTSGNAFKDSDRGTSSDASSSKAQEAAVGTTTGRRYGKGLDRPGFINPSSEPMTAGMAKQEELRREIRQLVLLSVANLDTTRASSDSKEWDNQGLYAGLAFIGLTLQYAEQEIAKIWANYETSEEVAKVVYPDRYSVKTDKQRREEGKELLQILPSIPSKTYQKIVSVRAAQVMVGHYTSEEDFNKIMGEIMSAVVVAVDPETIRSDVEAGLVDTKTASVARGYPEGSAEKAQAEHVLRVAAIAGSQTPDDSDEDGGPRGANDLSANPNAGKDEKKKASNADLDPNKSKRQRGKQKGGTDGTE